ncbi:3'-5' exoribonuclease [Lactobacillus mulieris]|uniref:exonuclease domain-containing protein n=1 Tax=Lactobacillus mulieris TaxID=2508708 RepID=UPI0014333CF7|nr:exonuclease domain-containing protein [Lactobacillus mulieris]MCF1783724.1 3'-5' exoribonuclease [Lactobacillus mulieris]MCW8104374.1 exonuclease domain-containing protein [Lactobacillus mulieris]MDK6803216.1 exonuclease domain-containing protein [Lactobacillus mulieris]MDK8382332.1 exonuclease domain-containing protein [Lactobacillus mulieris]MDT9620561.1 exonuclease domain-containing protein [Lactobacillus mulieris]
MKENIFKNKVVTVTRTPHLFSNKAEEKKLLEKMGATVKDKVTMTVDILIDNEPEKNSGNHKKAVKYGINILNEAEFKELAELILNNLEVTNINSNINEKGYFSLSEEILNNHWMVDIETIDLHNDRIDEIIELAAVHYINGTEVESFDKIICPQKFTSIDDIDNWKLKNLTKTNFTDEEIKNGFPIEQVLVEFLKKIKDTPLIAQNGKRFDFKYLKKNIEYCLNRKLANQEVDMLDISRQALPNLNSYSMDNLCKRFEVVNMQKHRAISDVKAQEEVLQKLQQLVGDNQSPNLKNKPTKRKNKHCKSWGKCKNFGLLGDFNQNELELINCYVAFIGGEIVNINSSKLDRIIVSQEFSNSGKRITPEFLQNEYGMIADPQLAIPMEWLTFKRYANRDMFKF